MLAHPKLIALTISRIKEQQTAYAESAVLRPSSDMLMTGLTAGKYQGLQEALDIIDGVLREDLDQEKRS